MVRKVHLSEAEGEHHELVKPAVFGSTTINLVQLVPKRSPAGLVKCRHYS